MPERTAVVEGSRRLSELPDILDRLPHLGEEEAEHFAEDIDQAREALGNTVAMDPTRFPDAP